MLVIIIIIIIIIAIKIDQVEKKSLFLFGNFEETLKRIKNFNRNDSETMLQLK